MVTQRGSLLTSLFETHPSTSLPLPFFSVHDPAWWWAEASNLRASSDAVVRFNLAHGAGALPSPERVMESLGFSLPAVLEKAEKSLVYTMNGE